MDARLTLIGNPAAAPLLKSMLSMHKALTGTTLSESLQQFVALRASQINGCAVCTDMHSKELLHAGESTTRVNLVATWREATVFTEPERAALELTEQGTRVADAAVGVSDEVWLAAGKHFDEAELVALVFLIAMINAANRINLITQQPAGSYQPGQLSA